MVRAFVGVAMGKQALIAAVSVHDPQAGWFAYAGSAEGELCSVL